MNRYETFLGTVPSKWSSNIRVIWDYFYLVLYLKSIVHGSEVKNIITGVTLAYVGIMFVDDVDFRTLVNNICRQWEEVQ